MERVFITSDDKATIICRKCKRSKPVDVAKLRKKKGAKDIRIKYRCPCGHSDVISFEKRKHYRKETNLPGVYFQYINGKRVNESTMIVKDISYGGVNLQVGVLKISKLKLGDKLLVEFRLDNHKKSIISRNVVITYVGKQNIGAEFSIKDQSDGLGFYLMNYSNKKNKN